MLEAALTKQNAQTLDSFHWNVFRLEKTSTAGALVHGAISIGVTYCLQTHLLRFTLEYHFFSLQVECSIDELLFRLT